jgi:hypothetical protein
VKSFWTDTLGMSGVGAGDLKDMFIKAMVGIEYAFKNLGPMLKDAWNAVVPIITQVTSSINVFMDGLRNRMQQLINDYNAIRHPFGLFGAPVPNLGSAPQIPMLPAIPNAGGAMEDFGDFMQRRLQEIGQGAAAMAADAMNAARGGMGQFSTKGTNEAATLGSADAFHLLEGTQASMEANMRSMLAQDVKNGEALQDILSQLRRSPVIARANIGG